MLLGDALDSGGRGLAQAIAGATTIAVLLLTITVLAPVAILTSLVPAAHAPRPPVPIAPVSVPGAAASVSVPVPVVPSSSVELPSPTGAAAVEAARRYLGVRYVFGGTNPAIGLDCSGLVQLVFRQLGISLPRTAQQQYEATVRVGRAELQPGDVVFFARTYADPHDWVTHVGIYIGDGLQINAPTEGQVVSIQPVFTGFWGAHFVSGGRPTHGH